MFLLLVLLLVISLQIDVGAIAVFKIRSLVYCIALMCGEKRDMCFDRDNLPPILLLLFRA